MITATERSTVLPDVPTSAEIGMPDLLAASWHAVVAPAGVPAARTRRLYETLVTALSERELREKMVSFSANPVGNSAAEFDWFLRAEIGRWRKVIEISGTKVE